LVGLAAGAYILGRQEAHVAKGMIPKVEVENLSTNALIYLDHDPNDDGGPLIIECISGRYVLEREAGRRYWIISMPLVINHCTVNKSVHTWPTFIHEPDTRDDETEGGE
jgi:hypothetical protein